MLSQKNPGNNTPTKQQLYGYLPPISQIIKIRQDMLGTAREARINS